MREYETVFIVDPGCDETEVDREVDTVRGVITEGSGEVVEVQVWGKRRLAYEINKKKEGTYAFVRFKCGPAVLQELNRRFKLNELVLRHLTVLSQEGAQEEEDSESAGPDELSADAPEVSPGS
ncbi:MAG: 30S ribosomal protein S6 [Candidatus Eiseniibacteriota bacterium]|nr:MAG: 30S ribosomal protein S6 [Candidatus Eisenbacteria bacterium]